MYYQHNGIASMCEYYYVWFGPFMGQFEDNTMVSEWIKLINALKMKF